MFFRDHRKEMLVMVVAVLSVMAFAYSAFSDMPVGMAGSFVGKVIAIDNAYKSITVRSLTGDEKIFTLSEHGLVLKCAKAETWDAIKIGDEVTVSYFEKTTGNYIADSVTLSSGMEKCS